jgi:hypothetical protein
MHRSCPAILDSCGGRAAAAGNKQSAAVAPLARLAWGKQVAHLADQLALQVLDSRVQHGCALLASTPPPPAAPRGRHIAPAEPVEELQDLEHLVRLLRPVPEHVLRRKMRRSAVDHAV